MKGLEAAWVLIFNAGQLNEGVYTVQDRAERAPAAVVAFESAEDAGRFAQLLVAEGLDLATPLCWDANQVAAFCGAGGYEVSTVPLGKLPTPPTQNDLHHSIDERRSLPRWQAARRDPYIAYRERLEAIFPRKPDNCGDDDCTVPQEEEEPSTAGAPAPGVLRDQAIAAIDAVLATEGDAIVQVDALLRSALAKAEADRRETEAAEQEGESEEEEGGVNEDGSR